MVLTNDVYLPTEEELTVPEVNLSGPALRAGAFHMGKACEAENNVSMRVVCGRSIAGLRSAPDRFPALGLLYNFPRHNLS